jgi:hypothetical protein
MTKRKRKNKIEIEKRKLLLENILDKWVYFKYIADNEDRYVFMKHRLRDDNSFSKIEQIVLSEDPHESGVYFITDYEIDRVLDYSRNQEIIEIRPSRFDQEIGLSSEKKKLRTYNDLKKLLIESSYLTEDDLLLYSNYHSKPKHIEEIFLSFSKQKEV